MKYCIYLQNGVVLTVASGDEIFLLIETVVNKLQVLFSFTDICYSLLYSLSDFNFLFDF